MKQAIILVGGPGSGKDLVLKTIIEQFEFDEYKAEQIKPKKFYDNNVVITCNAYNYDLVCSVKRIMENCYYKTSLVFVDVSDDVSRERVNFRNINEEARVNKLETSKQNLLKFNKLFKECHYFNNNYDSDSDDISMQLFNLMEKIDNKIKSPLEKFKTKINNKNKKLPGETYHPSQYYTSDGINPTYDTRAAGNGDLLRNYEAFDPAPVFGSGIGMGSNVGHNTNVEPLETLKDKPSDTKVFKRAKRILFKKEK